MSSSLLSKNVNIKVYRTIILPVVWYECETLSLTLREEGRLRVFENWVLGRIIGSRMNQVKEDERLVDGEGRQVKVYKTGMEEAPENGKESSHSAHANGMEIFA
jgi:hypothetical protein